MDLQLSPDTQLLMNDILVWIGYGTLVGLLARAVMPDRDPGGAIATLVMGITGVVIGCGVWSLVTNGNRVIPISPAGFVCGTLGAFVILLFYRILGGYWYQDAVPQRQTRRRAARRRRYLTAGYYD